MNFSELKVKNSKKLLGMTTTTYSDADNEKHIIVKNEFGWEFVLETSTLLWIICAVVAPTWMWAGAWYALLSPFGGCNETGKKCGWFNLRGMGWGEESKHGDKTFTSYTLNSIKASSRLPKAIGGFIIFLIISNIAVGSFCKAGYLGLLHNPNDSNQLCD